MCEFSWNFLLGINLSCVSFRLPKLCQDIQLQEHYIIQACKRYIVSICQYVECTSFFQRWKPLAPDVNSINSTSKSRLAVDGGEINTTTKTTCILHVSTNKLNIDICCIYQHISIYYVRHLCKYTIINTHIAVCICMPFQTSIPSYSIIVCMQKRNNTQSYVYIPMVPRKAAAEVSKIPRKWIKK